MDFLFQEGREFEGEELWSRGRIKGSISWSRVKE
jgi:hypothetical protein